MAINVVWARFGGGVTGVAAEEESSSNAGIIESPAIRSVIECFDATVYICGPILVKTKDILNGKYPELYKDYFKKIVICEKVEDEPEKVDLLWISSGSDNLRLTGNYSGISFPFPLNVYRLLAKYDTQPVVYFQTDFAAPFWATGEVYGGYYANKYNFERLWGKRKLNVIASGANTEYLRKFFWYYAIEEAVNIHVLPPDSHFLIDLDSLAFKYKAPVELTGIGFAGKERIAGSRFNTIKSFMPSQVPFTLGGKWKDESVATLKSLNNNFNFLGRFKNYNEVLNTYNKLGSTIYISDESYNNCKTVTSRFYDAIHAQIIPFINEPDYPLVREQFGDYPELVVNPSNILEQFTNFKDISKRLNLITSLYNSYKSTRNTVRSDFLHLIGNLLNKPGEKSDINLVRSSIHKVILKKVKGRRLVDRPKTEEEAVKVADQYLNTTDSLEDYMAKQCEYTKMQLGLFMSYPKKEDFSDVPTELINKYIDFIK